MWSVSFLFPLLLGVVLWGVLPLPQSGSAVVLSWKVLEGELDLSVSIIFDEITAAFLFMVFSVSFMVFFYSISYMQEEILRKKFILTMIIFVFSMLLLSTSGSLFWMMVGWDGLGLSSFLLIVFFSSWKSVWSGTTTFLLNRVGDFLIICSIFLSFSSGFGGIWKESVVLPLLTVFGALTKSAQVPFSPWLPAAMAAPTPVSSLVHSSTLVTAGVYIFFRMSGLLSESELFLISTVSVITSVLAFLASVVEGDMKKIIAFSTLSHISAIIYFISTGSEFSAAIHMVCHAFFKSLLFMVVGEVIHCSGNSQDLRVSGVIWNSTPMSFPLILSILSMIGGPFLAGFYSKENFIVFSSSLEEGGFFFFVFFIVFSSSFYSFRLLSFFYFSLPIHPFPGSPNKGSLILGSFLSITGSMVTPYLIGGFLPVEGVFSPFFKSLSLLTLFFSALMGALFSLISMIFLGKLGKLSFLMWGSAFLFSFVSFLALKVSSSHLKVVDVKGFLDLPVKIFSKVMKEISPPLLKKGFSDPLFEVSVFFVSVLLFFSGMFLW